MLTYSFPGAKLKFHPEGWRRTGGGGGVGPGGVGLGPVDEAPQGAPDVVQGRGEGRGDSRGAPRQRVLGGKRPRVNIYAQPTVVQLFPCSCIFSSFK